MKLGQTLLIFTFFIGLAFLNYRGLSIHFPHSDTLTFLRSRLFFETDFEYFKKMFSYDRAIPWNGQRPSLFRPGTTGGLALLDIFFIDKPRLFGSISIFLHGLTTFSMWVIFRGLKFKWSFLFALTFILHSSGMEMILWRQISLYMLSISFMCFGLYFWQKKKPITTLCLFFFSTLFHEITAFQLPLFWILLKLISTDKNRHLEILIPGILYWGINGLNCYTHQIIPALNWVHPTSLITAIKNIFSLSGLFLYSFLLPSLIQLSPSTGPDPRWELMLNVTDFYLGLGIAFFIFLFCLYFRLLRQIRFTSLIENKIGLFFCVYFIVLVLGLSLGRVRGNDFTYLKHSSYYFYFSNLILFLIFGFLVTHFRIDQSRFFLPLFLIGIFFLIFQSYPRTQERRDLEKHLATFENNVKKINSFFQDKSYCYGGPLDEETSKLIPTPLFFRISCALRKEAIPVYAILKNNKIDYHLKTSETPIESITPHLSFLNDFIRVPNLKNEIHHDRVFLSNQKYSPTTISMSVKNPNHQGLIFGCKDMKNYWLYLLMEGRVLNIYKSEKGRLTGYFMENLTIPSANTELAVRKIGERVYLLIHSIIWRELENPDLKGRIGFVQSEIGKDISHIQLSVERFHRLNFKKNLLETG